MPNRLRRALLVLILPALVALPACRGCGRGAASGPLLVAGFANTDANPALDLWNEWLTDMLVRGLWQQEELQVWSSQRSADLRQRTRGTGDVRAELLRLGREQGAGLVAFGAFAVQGAGAVVSVELLRADGGSVVRLEERADHPNAIPQTMDRLRDGIWEAAGVAPPAGARPVHELCTANPSAYGEFIAGERLYHEGAFLAAAQRFMRAGATDATFAVAHYRHATALMQYVAAPASDVQSAATIAWSHRQRTTARDQLAIQGLHALVTERPQDAATAYGEVRRRWPGDKELAFFHGVALSQLGSEEEAVTAFEEATGIDDRFLPAFEALANTAFALGDRERAARAAAAAVALNPADPRLIELKVLVDLYLGNLAAARTALDAALAQRLPSALVLMRGNLKILEGDAAGAAADFELSRSPLPLAMARLYMGELEGALTQLDQVSQLHVAAENRQAAAVGLWFTGHVLERNGDEELAVQQYTTGLNLHPELLDNRAAIGVMMARAGDAKRAGLIVDAMRTIGAKLRERGWERHPLRVQAAVAQAAGDYDQAVRLLRQARDLSRVRFLAGGFISDRPVFTDALAEALLAQGNLDEAGREFEALAAMQGERVLWPTLWIGAHVRLAEIAARQNRMADAQRWAGVVREAWGAAGGKRRALIDQALDATSRAVPGA